MILSFIRQVHLAPAALLALTLLACNRSGDEGAAKAVGRARTAELLGVLKLLRQEYANAVPPAGGTVRDTTEYSETQLFAEQAQAKFETLTRAGGAGDAARTRAIADGLARARAAVERKAPPDELAREASATIALVEDLMAGAVPEAVRGSVLATSRADQAIAAEEVVGEYRIGLATGPARQIFLREGEALVPLAAAPAGEVYVATVLRERRTKRFLPAGTVSIVIAGQGDRSEATLAELWGEFPQYGANIALPGDGPVSVTVAVTPPAYARHGDMLRLFVAPVTATLAGNVRNGTLTFDARPVQPTDADYAVGDDLLQATAETGELREAGPYRVGVIVEGPEPIWNWENGAPVLEPVAADATNHVEVVLVDRETGQLVPSAHVALTFVADGRPVGTATLHPLLSVFSHYGETLALPSGASAVRVHILPPALGSLDRPRLAEAAEIELPLPHARKEG